MKKIIIIPFISLILLSCWGNKEEWSCVEDWTVMYSQSTSWNIWWAQKWCSCDEMYNFELKTFWEVDTGALNSDFWCNF